MKPLKIRVAWFPTDFDRSVAFYVETLGLPRTGGWDRADGRGALIATTEHAIIELFGPPQGTPNTNPTPPQHVELAIEIGDARAWQDRLTAAGVAIQRELRDEPWGHRSFGIDDPDGVRIWLFESIAPT